MPTVIDKRRGRWRVIIDNEGCPFLYYPRSDIACSLLEKKNDDYCTESNCPLKEPTK